MKNGKIEGLMTGWNENGQKASEVQFKNGKEVSRKDF
jgi:antitoxin component YwqK of YwqJK toxin-antitoxin module